MAAIAFLRIQLLRAVLVSVQPEPIAGPMAHSSVHTAFSAECSPLFDWYAVGLFYSHRLSAQPGPITRLLACNRDQLAGYKGLSIGPTFVHPNLRAHALVSEAGNPTYNKPGSLALWLASPFAPSEEFVLFVDADMLIRSVRARARECERACAGGLHTGAKICACLFQAGVARSRTGPRAHLCVARRRRRARRSRSIPWRSALGAAWW